jgi:hypothetical protein
LVSSAAKLTQYPSAYPRQKAVLYFNPGSCSPRRFELPISVCLLSVTASGELEPKIICLDINPQAS